MADTTSWSYKAGEKGRNRVRAYRDLRDGKLYLEWSETVQDTSGNAKRRKARALLDTMDTNEAKQRADVAAAQFAELTTAEGAPVSVASLIHAYVIETKASKGISKQNHDRYAERLFRAFFGMQKEKARRTDRDPVTLDRIDWERFIAARRNGEIPGFPRKVRNTQIRYDLTFLISALNWGTAAKPEGSDTAYLKFNPWNGELRKAQKWPKKPKELNPKRPPMTDEIRSRLIARAPHHFFGAALIIERHTRRRNNAIRQLLWSECDMESRTILWRDEKDKAGRQRVTPMSQEVFDVLMSLERGIGDVPVFPSATDPQLPVPRNTWQTWLRRSKERAGVKVAGLGYHGEKRSGVRDPNFRKLPPKIQEELSGTNFETLKKIYDDDVSVDEMREAMQEAGLLSA